VARGAGGGAGGERRSEWKGAMVVAVVPLTIFSIPACFFEP
jgi:hypothetical protein